MRIDGLWLLCLDNLVRPVITCEVQGADGNWIEVRFLLDTGADVTSFSVDVFHLLGLEPTSVPGIRIEGVGGGAASVVVQTSIRLPGLDGVPVLCPGQFVAFTEPGPLELIYLGRNILNKFAVIVDREGDKVCLIRGRHRYIIQES